MADPRSEQEIAGGFIRVRMGGVVREIPTLKIAASRKWKDDLLVRLSAIGERDVSFSLTDGAKTMGALAPLANLATDTMVDVLLTYDTTGVLGGREWIEEHADDAEVYGALTRVLQVVFPFVGTVLEYASPLIREWLASRSGASSSTNGSLPRGASTPPPSKPALTKAS